MKKKFNIKQTDSGNFYTWVSEGSGKYRKKSKITGSTPNEVIIKATKWLKHIDEEKDTQCFKGRWEPEIECNDEHSLLAYHLFCTGAVSRFGVLHCRINKSDFNSVCPSRVFSKSFRFVKSC